jgi:catechol 2,3-dioxygenase-like lactoylglutathione lyase family enzyme
MNEGNVVGVAHTGITTSDLDRCIGFFRDILGMPVTEPVLYDDPIMGRITGIPEAVIRIAYVDLPGHRLELLQYLRPLQRRVSDLRPCDSGHLHLSLMVEGIDSLSRRMAKVGFELTGPIQRVEDAGGFRVIYTYGFDGLVIELMDFTKSHAAL